MKTNKKSPNNNDMMGANERLFSVFYLQTGALLRRCSSVVKSSETGVIPEQVNLLVRGIIRLQRCGEKVRRDAPRNHRRHFPEVSQAHPVRDSKVKSSTRHLRPELCYRDYWSRINFKKSCWELEMWNLKSYRTRLLLLFYYFCPPLLWKNVYYLVKACI